MRFLAIYTPDEKTAAAPPDKEHIAKMGKLVEESSRAGTLLATGAMLPLSKGGLVLRRADGEISVTDGPFTESKEVVAGFAVLQYASKEEAVEGVKQFLRIAGDGESKLFLLVEPPDR